MPEYIAYIDEAGDEGFGKLAAGQPTGQSRWLVIGACLVTKENDRILPAWRDQIVARFPKRATRDLHFAHLNHAQKIVVCQEIAARPIGACVTLSHKVTIPGSRWDTTFRQKGYLYNYLVRWLLERLSAECAAVSPLEPCSLRLVFSRRGGTDYHSMRRYLEMIRDEREFKPAYRKINWSIIRIEDIAVEVHAKWAGLQLADCITSAFFAGVNPDIYGNYEPRYAKMLAANVLRHKHGSALNHGVTPVPSLMASKCDDAQYAFFMSFVDKK